MLSSYFPVPAALDLEFRHLVVRWLEPVSAEKIRNHENIFVLGPTGVGKSFIACAQSLPRWSLGAIPAGCRLAS
jgi:hypothetical protein